MGKRNCAIEGCNALEFRSEGMCNRHIQDILEQGGTHREQYTNLQQEIVEEALDKASFQFASAEVFRCPNGCGELSYDRHDKVSEFNKKIAAVLGVLMLVAGIIIGEGWLILGSVVAFGLFLFATGETTAYFSCINCGGGMLDSKTIISKIGEDKALAIERALRNCEAGEKMCPSCEGRMNRIPITYVMPDQRSGNIGFDLIRAMIPNKKEYLDLDGCSSCGLFWFDSGEMVSISGSESMRRDFRDESKGSE